jgi:hypothetical protein
MNKHRRLFAVLAAPLLGMSAPPARADWTFLPVSRHQQFLTYGIFTEEQATLAFRDNRRAWAAIGDAIALVEKNDWSFRPQLIVFGSVNVSFRENSWLLDFLTETFDARFGFAVESILTPKLRLSVGMTHTSGHGADSLLDQDLVAPNLGDDLVVARVIYDIDERWRLGLTLKPAINTDPSGQALGGEQFAEWFPWGLKKNFTGGSPYLALGLEESGKPSLIVTYHAQLGLLWGNHFGAEKNPALRLVAGYYSGQDPRLKYAQIKHTRASFFYGGVMINL